MTFGKMAFSIMTPGASSFVHIRLPEKNTLLLN